MAGTLLGLGCGELDGSAEILLKIALRAGEEAGATAELVRLNELRIPSGPDAPDPDDAWWFWDRLVECDAFIVSTPIISRTVAARLKLLADRLLGPNADAAIIEQLVAVKRAGGEPVVPFRVDERVLKPRVAGFIAVGGSLTAQWKTLTLPVLHTTTFSMHMAVVDQVQFEGAGTPRSIVLDDAALGRAATLGRNVAEQIGRSFDEAEYRGEAGLCPLCHLDVVVLRGRDVECATCGARGRLAEGADGDAVSWTDLTTSVITMDEKRAHYAEIVDTAKRHGRQRDEIEGRAATYAAFDRLVRPPQR
jgi:multimeric flavodoxin WrbA